MATLPARIAPKWKRRCDPCNGRTGWLVPKVEPWQSRLHAAKAVLGPIAARRLSGKHLGPRKEAPPDHQRLRLCRGRAWGAPDAALSSMRLSEAQCGMECVDEMRNRFVSGVRDIWYLLRPVSHHFRAEILVAVVLIYVALLVLAIYLGTAKRGSRVKAPRLGNPASGFEIHQRIMRRKRQKRREKRRERRSSQLSASELRTRLLKLQSAQESDL
eukprot:scaffold29_cov251-Pinguiococcus_pyrenoidosus.AAC.19